MANLGNNLIHPLPTNPSDLSLVIENHPDGIIRIIRLQSPNLLVTHFLFLAIIRPSSTRRVTFRLIVCRTIRDVNLEWVFGVEVVQRK